MDDRTDEPTVENTQQQPDINDSFQEEPMLDDGGNFELEAPEASAEVSETPNISEPTPIIPAEPIAPAAPIFEQSSSTPVDNATEEPSSKSSQIKKYFLFVMIGGLVLSALISITAVLMGEFNDFMVKAVWTTLSIVAHSLVALAFVSVNTKHHTTSDDIILNTLFGITIASFVTSVFALWDVITGSIVGHLYLFFFYSLFAAVLCRALLQANRIDKYTRIIANTSIGLTIFLLLLLLPSVFTEVPTDLPDWYYRGIAATAILLGTTSVLTAVFHRLFVAKHPEQNTEHKKTSPLVIVVVILVLLFGVPLGFSLITNYLMTQSYKSNTSEPSNSEYSTDTHPTDTTDISCITDTNNATDTNIPTKISDISSGNGIDKTKTTMYSVNDLNISCQNSYGELSYLLDEATLTPMVADMGNIRDNYPNKEWVALKLVITDSRTYGSQREISTYIDNSIRLVDGVKKIPALTNAVYTKALETKTLYVYFPVNEGTKPFKIWTGDLADPKVSILDFNDATKLEGYFLYKTGFTAQ